MTTAVITNYTHNQDVAASTWTINHNLGSKPMVDVLLSINGQLQKVYPLSVTHSSDNTTVITWTAARTGKAILSTAI